MITKKLSKNVCPHVGLASDGFVWNAHIAPMHLSASCLSYLIPESKVE